MKTAQQFYDEMQHALEHAADYDPVSFFAAAMADARRAALEEVRRLVSALADYEFKCPADHVGVFEIVDEFEARALLDDAGRAT